MTLYENRFRFPSIPLHRNQNQSSMAYKIEKQFGEVKVVHRSDNKRGVIDLNGVEIVPFGKYDWIDYFDHGLARVKIGKEASSIAYNHNKWGIINKKGEEVLPVIYENIWNFYDKNRYSTKVVLNGCEYEVCFHDLNPDLPVRGIRHKKEQDSEKEDAYGTHYGEFAGSYAQDVAGYSDDVINDAFEGDPDAYWNID